MAEPSTMSGGEQRRSSPAARAFFAALDEAEHDGGDDQRKAKQKSPFVHKRAQSLGWRNRYSQEERYPITLYGGRGRATFTVGQVQRGEVEGAYGTGATVWPASIVLVKYLARHGAALLRGKRVFDLGAGTGVASIAAAVLGAAHCVCTDGEASVVALARDNILRAAHELDKIRDTSPVSDPTVTTIRGCRVEVAQYWWGSGAIPGCSADGGCDVVLVSDCVLPKLYPVAPLVQALDELLPPHHARPDIDDDSAAAVAIMSYEHRYYADYDPRTKFRDLCAVRDLEVRVIDAAEHDPIYSVDDIEIWHVRRRRRDDALPIAAAAPGNAATVE